MKFMIRLLRAKKMVNWRWSAAESNESIKSGTPSPNPNQRNTHSWLNASAAVKDSAKMLTTMGPEQGSAIGP